MRNNNNYNAPFACLFLLITLLPTLLHASAFSLYTESNGAAVGNFAAGIAADPQDASIGWYNPAGLAFLHHDQVVAGGVAVQPFVQLSGNTLYTIPNPLDSASPFLYAESFPKIQGARSAGVPSLHLAHPLGPHTTLGFSAVVPFGLSTDWAPSSAIRYEATYSKLTTLDFSPELGSQLTDSFNAGFGFDFEYATVTFNQVIGAPSLLSTLDIAPNALDSASINQGTSFDLGFHAGLLWHINQDHTRLGLNYQSPINQTFRGTSQLKGPLADPTLNVFDLSTSNPNAFFQTNTLFSNNIALPGIATFSAFQDVAPRLSLLGSLVYTAWHTFENIKLYNVAAVISNHDGSIQQVPTNVSISQNYQDTWRVAVGANYHIYERLLLRIGGGYEQTPSMPVERDARLPDADRSAASIGAHYQFGQAIGLDVGYTHLFIHPTVLHHTDHLLEHLFHIDAEANAHANLVGAQLVWTID